MGKRIAITHRRNRIAATLVAAIACAGAARGDEPPLTPLTPVAESSTPPERPAQPTDGYSVAAEHFAKFKWGEAAEAFQAFLVERPEDPRAEQAWFYLGEARLRDGRRPETAAEAFRQVLKTATGPATVAAAQFRLCESLHLARRHSEAVAELEKFLDAQPRHPAAHRAWSYLAECAFAAGKFEQAESAAAYFTACYPDDASAPRAALLQAAALLQLGRTHESRIVLTPLEADASAERDPTVEVLAASLEIAAADEALNAGDLETAVTRYRQFVERRKQHELAPYAAFRLAELASAAGKWRDAATQFAAVLAHEKLSDELRPLAWLAQVQALAQDRDWDEVLAVAAAAKEELNTWPRRYEFDYLRGRAHLAKAEMNEARTAFGLVSSASDASGTETAALAQYMIAETHFLQRRYDAALADYRRVADHEHPRWQAAAQLQAGKCCERLNRHDEAQASYDALLRDFADSPFAAEAQTRREACLRQASAPAPAQRK